MSFYFRWTEVILCQDEVRNKYSSCFVFNYIGYMNPHPPVYTLQIRHEHFGFFHSLIFYLKLTMGLLFLLCLVFLAMVLFLCRLSFHSKISMLWQMTIELSCSSYVIWNICQHFSNISGLKKTSLRRLM